MGLHLHEMRDTDKHFIIDPVTRAITNANAAKNKLIQFDHNSEIFTFEIPQYVDGHDMNKCDKVEIHYINIDGKTKEQSKDLFNAKAAANTDSDLVFNIEGEKLLFCWKISGNATKYAGSLNFLVCFSCIDDAGVITYKWHTDIFKGIIISDGLSNTEAVAEQYSDVLEQWKKELENASGSGSGSGGSYVVNIIDNGDDTFRTDKTFAQIQEAIAAGKEAVCVFGTYHYQLVSCTDTKIVFSVSECEGVVSYKTITLDNTNGDGEVTYKFDMPGYQYETDGNLQTEDITVVGAINEVNTKVNGVINNGTVISENADFAEVGEWSDGNPDAEDRTGYFVSVDTSEPGKTMVKATSTSDVRGVTMLHPAFSGNASADKYDADGNLLPQYAYVGFAGFVPVIDNGTCTVNGHCMPSDDGTAIPSSNNMGYQVIERIDDTHVLVLVEPQADMMVRIKKDVSQLSEDLTDYAKTTDIPDKLPNPKKLTFTGAVTAEYDGSGAVTVTIPNGSGGSGGTVRIEKLSTDTAVELEPNKLYIFPEMAELTITLAEPSDTGIANEYHFVFQSGATATTLSIPDAIKIPSGFSVDVNKIYELSVMENCLAYQSWDVIANA